MPGGEGAHWPLCAVCSEFMGEPTTVEEYGVPPDSVVWRGDADTRRIVRFERRCPTSSFLSTPRA